MHIKCLIEPEMLVASLVYFWRLNLLLIDHLHLLSFSDKFHSAQSFKISK